MKKFLAILFIIGLSASCQHDETDVISQDESETIAMDSPLIKLITRVSQNPTEYDNIIDNSGCYSVALPVEVEVNDQYLDIESESDFGAVEALKDQSPFDDDIVHFSYPITVIFPDFTEHVIENQQQLYTFTKSCEDPGFYEIGCISFNFPLRVDVYNTVNQIATSMEIADNQHLYNFICSISSQTIVGFRYPLSLTDSNGNNVNVTNNDDLENAIVGQIGLCDNSHNIGTEPLTFNDIITDGTWYVSFCEAPGGSYGGYSFTFYSNGTIAVIKNGTASTGAWMVAEDGADQLISLAFSSDNLHELENNFKIIEYNDHEIRLKKNNNGSGGPGGTVGEDDYLYFTKN